MDIFSQDTIPLYNDASEIVIPFPHAKYKRLLKLCNLKLFQSFSEYEVSIVFVNAVYNFLIGKFSQDDISSIAEILSSHLLVNKNTSSEIYYALQDAMELAFYSRRIYSKDDSEKAEWYINFMNHVMRYYERHRNQVIKGK